MASDDLPPSLRNRVQRSSAPVDDLPPSLRTKAMAVSDVPPSMRNAIPNIKTGFPNWEIFKSFYGNTPLAKPWSFAKKMEGMSKEGLRGLASYVPEPNTTSPTANVILGTPSVAAKTLAEFAPSFISPEALALNLVGPVAEGVAGSPYASRIAKAILAKTPEGVKAAGTAVKRALTYRFGQPEPYKALAENTGVNIANLKEAGRDVGKALEEGLSKGQRLRLGQIIEGSSSVSEKELPLRLRAAYARDILDTLQKEAQDLSLIPKTTLSQYSKKQMAQLRLKKAVLDARIESLKNFGQPAKEQLLAKADKLNIVGATGLVRKIENVEATAKSLEDMLGNAKDVLTAEEFKGLEDIMSHENLRRSKAVTKLIQRFEKSNIGSQEKMFDRLISASERMGVKVDDLYNSELSIGNFRGLLKRINKLSNRFPGKAKLIRDLESKSQGIQEKIVDYYTNSGKKYSPRMYKFYEAPTGDKATGFIQGFSQNRMNMQRFMKRENISEAQRLQMGEIKEPAYPVAKGIMQVGSDVEQAKMFRTVAQNPEWAVTDPVQAAAKEFTQMPTTRRLGDLSGKFVHPEIARDINSITAIQSAPWRAWKKINSVWKFGKVVLSPAAQGRNAMSNTMLADIVGGVDLLEQPKLLPMAAREMAKKGKYFQEAKQAGLLGHEFVGGELEGMRDRLLAPGSKDLVGKIASGAKKVAAKAGDVYQNTEQTFKMMIFMKHRMAGESAIQAAKIAENALFDYSKVSPAVKAFREMPLGSPFVTFTTKAIPAITKAAIKNPLSVYKYYALFNAVEKVAKERLKLSDSDFAAIKRSQPGQSLVLPIRDSTKRPVVLDLSYVLPWGDIGEQGGMAGLPSVLSPGGPLKSLLEVGFNKNTFTNKPIFGTEEDRLLKKSPTATAGEKAAATSDFLLRSILPSLTPGVNKIGSPFKGGYGFQKLTGGVDRQGRATSLPMAIASSILGIKMTPVSASDVRMNEARKLKTQMENLQFETRKVLTDARVSKEEKAKFLANTIAKTKRLVEAMKNGK